MNTLIVDAIVKQLKGMPQELQQQVLEFAQALSTSQVRGTPGSHLLRFASSIPADDLQLMEKAIERDCGRVNFDEW